MILHGLPQPPPLTAAQQAALALQSDSGGDMALTGGIQVATPSTVSPLVSVADWSTIPYPWIRLNPSGNSQLTMATSHVLAEVLTMVADHGDSTWSNDHAFRPTAIARPIDERDFLVNFELGTVLNHTNIVGAKFAWVTMACARFGRGGDHLGSWFGGLMEFNNGAGGGAGDPFWYMKRWMKPGGDTVDIESSRFNLNEVDSTAPASPGMRMQLDSSQGWNQWGRKLNTDSWTALGGGSIATGFVDPGRATVSNVGGISAVDAGQLWLVLALSTDYNMPVVGNSVQLPVGPFTVESATL